MWALSCAVVLKLEGPPGSGVFRGRLGGFCGFCAQIVSMEAPAGSRGTPAPASEPAADAWRFNVATSCSSSASQLPGEAGLVLQSDEHSVTLQVQGCSGFLRFLDSGELSDVQVMHACMLNARRPHRSAASDVRSHLQVTVGDSTFALHGVVLASQSEFFHKALSSGFAEGRPPHKVSLETAHPGTACVFMVLVRFFYADPLRITGENVLPLMALARQLMVPTVEEACMRFIQSQLRPETSLSLIQEAVMYQLEDVLQDCVRLAAKGARMHEVTAGRSGSGCTRRGRHVMRSLCWDISLDIPPPALACSLALPGLFFLYDSDVAGLPPQTVLEILRHEDLMVHCEKQASKRVVAALTHLPAEEPAIASLLLTHSHSQPHFTTLPFLRPHSLLALSRPRIPSSLFPLMSGPGVSAKVPKQHSRGALGRSSALLRAAPGVPRQRLSDLSERAAGAHPQGASARGGSAEAGHAGQTGGQRAGQQGCFMGMLRT